MQKQITIIGAPSSAGAYAPGQEKAPDALRETGLPDQLASRGFQVEDRGNVPGFRWRADSSRPRAMNVEAAANVARAVSEEVTAALAGETFALVLGGDCTVELGTVAGALSGSERVGLVYIDLDTDLNTPESTEDGALDWMGGAHMLGVEGAVPELVEIGPVSPLLQPDQILFFSNNESKPFERQIIEEWDIAEMPLPVVQSDPAGAAGEVVENWAGPFDRLLIHLDLDVLDYLDMPLAENTRRNIGLQFDQLMEALTVLLRAPNCAALTITELNPDHGAEDGSTLREFSEAVADALAGRLRRKNRK